MNLYSYAFIITIIAITASLAIIKSQYSMLAIISGALSWYITRRLMPKVRELMLKKGIFGYDLNKKGSKAGEKQIPQCQGFSAAISFCMVCLALTPIIKLYSEPHKLATHLSVLVTVIGTILLGFADDNLDLQWRYKLLFPFFIIIPLVSTYTGPTHFQVIYPFSLLIGRQLQLSFLYLLYITCLGIYKTNTINIMAGINGLEVGQSIIAASSMLLYFFVSTLVKGQGDKYVYSIILLTIFLAGALVLLKQNQYPAKIFIGDTFCYFAGIVLAIAAIFGQIPVVCHWFFIPQLINFLYSIPQLIGYYPCPRHRLAEFNASTGKLQAIETNMNMLNLSLRWLGPTNEGSLCLKLLLFQLVFCLLPLLHVVIFSRSS